MTIWQQLRGSALALWTEWLQPANVILLLMVFALGILLIRAQRRPDVDFVQMLRTVDGHLDWAKFSAIGAFVVSTWIVMIVTVTDAKREVLEAVFYGYLIAWSGSVAISKWLDKK